jgi:hypothetical protein
MGALKAAKLEMEKARTNTAARAIMILLRMLFLPG